MTILSFGALFVGLGVTGDDAAESALITLGVFLGSTTWWIVLTAIVGALHTRVTPALAARINVGSGLVIGGFAIALDRRSRSAADVVHGRAARHDRVTSRSTMTGVDETQSEMQTSEIWRRLLTGEDPSLRSLRRMWRHVPSSPRCKVCAAPFHGLGGLATKVVMHGQSRQNPLMCGMCFGQLRKRPGGAEIELSVLFADVRGSTAIAERTTPDEFRHRIQKFYEIGTKAIESNGGTVDKFLGDGIMALFIPVLPASNTRTAQSTLLVTSWTTSSDPICPRTASGWASASIAAAPSSASSDSKRSWTSPPSATRSTRRHASARPPARAT